MSANRKTLITWGVAVTGTLALMTWAALAYTGQPGFCATCHLMQTRYVSWARSDHSRAAACMDCHAEPGALGEIKAHLNGARYLWVLATGRPQVILRAEVPQGTCAKCHPIEDLPTEAEGVRLAHRAHFGADVRCEECHAGFHNDLGGGDLRSGFDGCTRCHGPQVLYGLRALGSRGSSTPGAR